LAEGIKGKRAVDWNLVDAIAPRSRFNEAIAARARELAAQVKDVPRGPAVALAPLEPVVEADRIAYRYVELAIDRDARVATLTVNAPGEAPPTDPAAIARQGSDLWALR